MPTVLYKTNLSPPARAALMLVDILGLSVETREVNLPAREHFKPEYLEKNPLHTVPMLEDGDLVLVDSHAIITYLISAYGNAEQKKLYPIDAIPRAKIDQRLYFDATILFPRLRNTIYSVVKKGLAITEEQVNDIIEAYNVTEKYLEKSLYIAGDNMTLADLSCVATLSSMDCIVPITDKYVKIHEWWNRFKKESWYQKENEPGLNIFASFMKQFL